MTVDLPHPVPPTGCPGLPLASIPDSGPHRGPCMGIALHRRTTTKKFKLAVRSYTTRAPSFLNPFVRRPTLLRQTGPSSFQTALLRPHPDINTSRRQRWVAQSRDEKNPPAPLFETPTAAFRFPPVRSPPSPGLMSHPVMGSKPHTGLASIGPTQAAAVRRSQSASTNARFKQTFESGVLFGEFVSFLESGKRTSDRARPGEDRSVVRRSSNPRPHREFRPGRGPVSREKHPCNKGSRPGRRVKPFLDGFFGDGGGDGLGRRVGQPKLTVLALS